ncbi:hypothetical protein C7B82_13525 [Stenomitos frigidus ULC18]|uniref:Gamma-glutamylcyclotransferase AIG2-like domain-containing protein n=1 Tax=Stenomitos frigidus ULC18 TaxID=2107698 RepID=A0A2T1E6Z5_9CYAN|nr:hypothetical protein C7B82_13525 [Stenomitos frigidus ULC18]
MHVFVYGTLKPGEINYSICADDVVESQPAIADGCLYALPLGYPAMTLEAGTVRGALLSFIEAAALERLDEFERHDPIEFLDHAPGQCLEKNEYERKQITVYDSDRRFLGLAWSYIMTPEQVQQLGGRLLPNGQWPSLP